MVPRPYVQSRTYVDAPGSPPLDYRAKFERVNDRPRPDYLARLKIVDAYLRFQQEQVSRWIAEEERKIAAAEARQPPPPPPDWLIERGIGVGRPAVYVHVGDCPMIQGMRRAADQAQARQALADGVEACPHCRPDTELGLLD